MAKTLDAIVIGGGPSGIIAANTLLEVRDNIRVTLVERSSCIGGTPILYRNVPPNTRFDMLYKFFMDLANSRRISDALIDEYDAILDEAQQNPRFGIVGDAVGFMHKRLLSPQGNRFRTLLRTSVDNVIELEKGYQVNATQYDEPLELRGDIVVCATGACVKKHPYEDAFGERVIPLHAALNEPRRQYFEGKRVVIAGASHSGAIAFVNALRAGAEYIEVWYKGEPFPENEEARSSSKKHFSGIRDPVRSQLKEAMSVCRGKYNLRQADTIKGTHEIESKYGEWVFISAIGFEQNTIDFTCRRGRNGKLTTTAQGLEYTHTVPHLYYPGTRESIPLAYGLGSGFPLRYTKGLIPNTEDKEGTAAIGVYFTYILARQMARDVASQCRN